MFGHGMDGTCHVRSAVWGMECAGVPVRVALVGGPYLVRAQAGVVLGEVRPEQQASSPGGERIRRGCGGAMDGWRGAEKPR